MKAAGHSLSLALPSWKSWVGIGAELVKARLNGLVLLSTASGFYLGSRDAVDWVLLLHTLLGTGLLAGGAAALNQWMERDYDARMRRTRDRPLPSHQLQPSTALALGLVACVLGLVGLTLQCNRLAGGVGAATAAIYLMVYTPLKRITWLNTLVGAIPGSLPPLIGWAAARHNLALEGWIPVAIQFCWQVPHFLAIAWIYRDDYAQAGFVMLPGTDGTGRKTGTVALACCVGAVLASALPLAAGTAGAGYLACALGLGGAFTWSAVVFRRRLTLASARQLFLMSLVYLPLLFALLVCFKGASSIL
jgi:heme o synthase